MRPPKGAGVGEPEGQAELQRGHGGDGEGAVGVDRVATLDGLAQALERAPHERHPFGSGLFTVRLEIQYLLGETNAADGMRRGPEQIQSPPGQVQAQQQGDDDEEAGHGGGKK